MARQAGYFGFRGNGLWAAGTFGWQGDKAPAASLNLADMMLGGADEGRDRSLAVEKFAGRLGGPSGLAAYGFNERAGRPAQLA